MVLFCVRNSAGACAFLHENRGARRRRVVEDLAAIPPGEGRFLLAVVRQSGEGFGDARVDMLFLAMPISWKVALVQYAGRLHR